MRPRDRAAALTALLGVAALLQLAHAQSTLPAPRPPHAYWQVKPASHTNGRMRYRLQLLGRTYCTANSQGALTAPTCNDGNWWDRTPRLNTWQTGGYGQWDLEVSSWRSPDPNTPIMNTPIVISNVGRAFPWGCLSGYLAASGCGYAARLSSSRWRRSSRWQLEPVPGRPYVFYISSLSHRYDYYYGCSRHYLGAARACRPGGNPRAPEDPCLGLYSQSSRTAFTMWQLVPVNPCEVQGAACTSSAQCCQESGLSCVGSVCAAAPAHPGFSGNAPSWWDPNLTLQLDLTEPTNNGGAAVTLYRVVGTWGSGAEAKIIEANSTTPEVVFSGNRYPWLCGKRWRFRATATNGAGTSSVFTFGVTTEACKGPEGLTFKAFVPSGAAPITLDVQLNPPTQTFGLPVTQYSVKLEHQGTAAEGLLTYTRDSATANVAFPGAEFPWLCGREWAATAWATTSAGRSEEEFSQWNAPACPSPAPPAGIESSSVTPSPPTVDSIVRVTLEPSSQTWGFAPESYIGRIRSQDGQVECLDQSPTKELAFDSATCGGFDVCGRTWDLTAAVVTTSGQQSEDLAVTGFLTVPAC